MTSKGVRLVAQLVLMLALPACRPRTSEVAPPLSDAAADGAVPTDAGVDGDAGPPCVLGGTTALAPVVVACAQPNPARLAVDDENVYWTVQKGGPIVMKAPLAGGGAVPLVYDSAAAVGIAIDALFVYYTQPTLGRVMRVPIAGGPAVALATKLDGPLFLALADGALYWTGGTGPDGGGVLRLALAPGAKPVVLIDGQARPRALAVRDGFVYWTDFGDGTVLRMPADAPDAGDGGLRTATRLASGLMGPSDLALAGGFAYVPDQSGRVARVALEGGALEIVAEVNGIPFGLATDGLSLYWSTLGKEGGIFKSPLAAGAATETIAAGEPDPHFLAVSDVAVFWGTWGGGGAIKKKAK